MKTLIWKWGNSLALRIPKSFVQETGLESNSPVDVSLEGGKLVMVPVAQLGFTLERLPSQITEDNLHSDIDMVLAIGIEEIHFFHVG
jgi:antitoxin MazE